MQHLHKTVHPKLTSILFYLKLSFKPDCAGLAVLLIQQPSKQMEKQILLEVGDTKNARRRLLWGEQWGCISFMALNRETSKVFIKHYYSLLGQIGIIAGVKYFWELFSARREEFACDLATRQGRIHWGVPRFTFGEVLGNLALVRKIWINNRCRGVQIKSTEGVRMVKGWRHKSICPVGHYGQVLIIPTNPVIGLDRRIWVACFLAPRNKMKFRFDKILSNSH